MERPSRMNFLRRVLKGIKHLMYDFNRKLLSGWAISIFVVVLMVFSIFDTGSKLANNLDRESQLEKKQNNPFGYQDNEVIEKIIVDRGKNQYSYEDIYKDIDKMKSYYIIVWDENNSVKNYQKVSYDYFKKVHPGDTWDGKMTTSEEENDDDYDTIGDYEW